MPELWAHYPAAFEALTPMNVLLIGSGGREHALAWAISAQSRC